MNRVAPVCNSLFALWLTGCTENLAAPDVSDGGYDASQPGAADLSLQSADGGAAPTERVATLKTTATSTYVGATDGGGSTVYADRYAPQAWETFQLIDVNGDALTDGDTVQLRTLDGHYLSVAGGTVSAAATTAGATETFRLGLIAKASGSGQTIADGDSISLQVSGGTYLSAINGGGSGLESTSTQAKAFETFLIGPASGLPTTGSLTGWSLVWSDEFSGASGPIDGSKWTAEVNGSPANNELEYYTDRLSNVALDGKGNLTLIARAEPYQGHVYTSGRVNTAGHFSQTYGRFEARVQMPTGRGIWPAFWTLGGNIGSVGWPQCGELDIMETVGTDTGHNYGSAHGPGYSGGNPLTAGYTYPGTSLTDGFHDYAIEWEPNQVRWYVDGRLFETRTPADLPAGTTWVYDHPFFIILNVAVGGTWPGSPDGTTAFPQVMKVDYVRVYKKAG